MLVVQLNEFPGILAVQVHGAIFGTDTSVTPAGSVSETVVVPVDVVGHSFLTSRV